MLFVDCSSAFNTISLMKLTEKTCENLHEYHNLQLDSGLPHKPLTVLIGHTSFTLVPNSAAPQDCMLSPLIFTAPMMATPDMDKSPCELNADDTDIIGQISGNNKSLYQEEITRLTYRCTENNLLFNISKT